MKKLLSSRKGEMYIEAVITIVVLISILVFALGTFRVATVKTKADAIADQLLETATFYGCFGDEFDARLAQLHETYPNMVFTVEYDGEWYNTTQERVQLGDIMTVTVYFEVELSGFGASITVPLHTTRTGASENYWRANQ